MIDSPVADGTSNAMVESGNGPTLTELVSGIADDAQRLIQQQYQMLRAEVKEDLRRTKSAVAYMGFGAGAVAIGAVFLAVAVPLLINWAFGFAPWVGWAIVGGVMLVVGIIGLFAGKRIFEKNNPLPDKTLNALEENLSWIANRRK